MKNKDKHIGIVGAGLAGSLLALMLRKENFKVSVFEKRVDPRFSKIPEGRSINLALSDRGISALKAADVYGAVAKDLIPMKGRMMHDTQGKLSYQPYGKEGQSINSISRNELNKALILAAAEHGVDFNFGNSCERIDIEKTELTNFHNGKYTTCQPDGIIGADGAFSLVRKAMQFQDRFNYQQYFIGHGYKELSMPPRNGEFAMEKNYLHIWPRGQFMLIALPNPDKTFTCTLFLAFEGEVSFENLSDSNEVLGFFEKYFADVIELIPDLTEQFAKNPTSSLVTIRCEPWFSHNTMLIGDASHAIVPFYGQGMNAAFEDCRIFMEEGRKMNFEWESLIQTFSTNRKKDADAISELALRNFIEMRDKVGDDLFLERKKTDMALHEKYGERWIPMYSMVTFSDIPYHQALQQGEKQEKLLVTAQRENYLDDLERIIQEVSFSPAI